MTSISTSDLKVLFELLISRLEEEKILEVEFKMDEYWIIATDDWDNFEEVPAPVVGSLSDDIESLKKPISNDFFSFVDFDRLASVIRAISEQKAPTQ